MTRPPSGQPAADPNIEDTATAAPGMSPDVIALGYSAEEWHDLTRYYCDTPEGWEETRRDADALRQEMLAICRRHEIQVAGEIAAADNGTNAVLMTGDVVVKIFAEHEPVWFARELEAYRVLEAIPDALTPRVLAWGEPDDRSERPYMVLERLPGAPFRNHREEMTEGEKLRIARGIGRAARALHTSPIESLAAFGGKSHQEWKARMLERARICRASIGDEMPHHLSEGIDPLLAKLLPLLDEPFDPLLLSADIVGGNVLVEHREGGWQMTGLIDFGDAEVGPLEYELISVCQKALVGDKAMMRAFFESYGIPLPLSRNLRRRLMLYTLLHRFTPLLYGIETIGTSGSLEEIVEEMWGL